MDDSDDYFQGSLVLDQEELEVLAREEAKLFTPTTLSLQRSSPFLKRRKLSHPSSSIVCEDSPEITLKLDGSYTIRHDGATASNVNGGTSIGHAEQPGNANRSAAPFISTSIATQTHSPSRPASSRGTSHRSVKRAVHPVIDVAGTSGSRLVTPTVIHKTPPNHISQPQSGVPANPDWLREMDVLKAQLDELRSSSIAAQDALLQEREVRYAKEGEVSILRQAMTKAAQDHASDVARLQAIREAAEARQAQIQREMKEEIERIRTEFNFRKHEAETSTRKMPSSARSRRSIQAHMPSPVPIPPAMRNWVSQSALHAAAMPKFSPSRRRIPGADKRSRSPCSPRKGAQMAEPKFPGFENSFLPPSPTKSPTRRRQSSAVPEHIGLKRDKSLVNDKGKQRATVRETIEHVSPLSERRSLLLPVLRKSVREDAIPSVGLQNSSPQLAVNGFSSPAEDLGDTGVGLDVDEGDVEIESEFEGLNWRDELHHLLLSHTLTASTTLTFQYLLSLQLPSVFHPGVTKYRSACSTVLEALGATYKYNTVEKLAPVVARGMLAMGRSLVEASQPTALEIVLDLLCSMMLFIPSFSYGLAAANCTNGSGELGLVLLMREIVETFLQPPKQASIDRSDSRVLLLKATLSLIEMVAWTVPSNATFFLTEIPRSEGLFLTLLNQKQPPDVLTGTIRTLVVLAMRTELCHSFLHFHVSEICAVPPRDPNIPLLERLSRIVVDCSCASDVAQSECVPLIIVFFTLLADADDDGRMALVRSTTVIPALISYLSQLTTWVWEDDERIASDSPVAFSPIRNLKQALLLLHHLVLAPLPSTASSPAPNLPTLLPPCDLRQKLLHAPHSAFNGLAHLFIVMIGRLSFADPPDWLPPEAQAEIEQITEPARDLMDLIVEGPEGDSIWGAYQEADEGAGSVTEEDEMDVDLVANES